MPRYGDWATPLGRTLTDLGKVWGGHRQRREEQAFRDVLTTKGTGREGWLMQRGQPIPGIGEMSSDDLYKLLVQNRLKEAAIQRRYRQSASQKQLNQKEYNRTKKISQNAIDEYMDVKDWANPEQKKYLKDKAMDTLGATSYWAERLEKGQKKQAAVEQMKRLKNVLSGKTKRPKTPKEQLERIKKKKSKSESIGEKLGF